MQPVVLMIGWYACVERLEKWLHVAVGERAIFAACQHFPDGNPASPPITDPVQ